MSLSVCASLSVCQCSSECVSVSVHVCLNMRTCVSYQSCLLGGDAFVDHDILDEFFDLQRMLGFDVADHVAVSPIGGEARRAFEPADQRRLLLLLRVRLLHVLLLR